jgi:ATP-dependent Clp protease ATP-binding subunit ClpA
VFKPLSKLVLNDIFSQKLKDFYAAWKTKAWIKLPKFTKRKIEKVIDEIYDPAYGARPLDRYLLDKVEPWLIDQVIHYEMNK